MRTDFFPLPDDCNNFYLAFIKETLVNQLGIDEGFRALQAQLSPSKSINHARPQRIRPNSVRSLRVVAESEGAFFCEMHPSGETFDIPPPRFVGDGDAHALAGTARSSYVACLSNARIHGRSAFLSCSALPALDFEPFEIRETDDRWSADPYVFTANGGVAWEMQFDQPTLELDEAFGSLLGVCSMGWGHWFGDYVPKYIAAVCSGHLRNVPVLVDSGMPETHRQLLELVLADGAEIIEVSPEYEILVHKLWCAPSLGYAPLLPWFNDKFAWDKFCTVPARWAPVLSSLGRAVDKLPQIDGRMERLYLSRKPFRWTKLLNSQAIESILRLRGFTVLYPEDYSLHEVAGYVRNARYVMGPLGSQMVNACFARPGTHVCYLTHPYLLGAWPYFLSAIDVDVTMLSGPVVNLNNGLEPPNFGYPHHADYTIDPDTLTSFLDAWLAQ